MKTSISLLCLTSFATAVSAQQPAPAAAAPFTIKHTCVKAEWPGRVTTDSRKKLFDREYKEYTECIKKFVEDQSKANQEMVLRANAHVAAGNAAIAEYNDYIKELNKVSGKED